jgi:hypothetical protein
MGALIRAIFFITLVEFLIAVLVAAGLLDAILF